MQANNFFSAGRFGLYFKKHVVDNYRYYAMSVFVLTGLLLFFLLFVSFTRVNFDKYSDFLPIYFIGLFLTGLIFTSIAFSELGAKPRGIDYLLLPASHFEKFLTTLLFTTVFFLLVYHLAFFLAFRMISMITLLQRGTRMENDLDRFLRKPWEYWYFGWFWLQAIFLLGAVYFHRYSFVKTAFVLLLALLALYCLNGVFTFLLFGNRIERWNHQVPFVGVGIHGRLAALPEGMQDVLLFAGKYLATPLLWTIAYLRLRDKEM